MTRALIVGAGIAGPAAALALQRAGIDPVICERGPDGGGDRGTYLTVAANGMAALQVLGADARVRERAFPTSAIDFRDGSGRHLARVPIGAADEDGPGTHTIRRSDLSAALLAEARRRGAAVEFGRRLVAAEIAADGVAAVFADGTRAEADLLVGCDGVHSAARGIIAPGAPAPRYTGLLNIGGFTRDVPAAGEPGTYRMVFGRRAFFGYTVSPDGEVWWFANPGRRSEPERDLLGDRASEHWKRWLLALFRRDRSPAAEIVRATSGPVYASASYELDALPAWHRGGAVLLGDAAHAASPASGQGASMAAEDAVVLAKCLRDLPDTERALAAFHRLRRDRVARVVAQGARSSRFKAVSPLFRPIRDRKLPKILGGHAAGRSALAGLFDHRIRWEEPVTEPGPTPAGRNTDPRPDFERQ